jgi:ribose-phosphate pyrophosphokinase
MLVVCDESNSNLAQRIADNLCIDCFIIKFNQFKNSEYYIENQEIIKSSRIILVFPKSHDINASLLKFILMHRLCHYYYADAIIPYIPYSRQDKSENFSAIADLLNSLNLTRIVTIDIHSELCVKKLKIPITNIMPHDIFSQLFLKTQNTIIIAPDIGAINRAEKFAQKLNLRLEVFDKTTKRFNNNIQIKRKKCIIVDDIIDSGKTILLATKSLLDHSAANIVACVSHGIFSNNSIVGMPKIYVSETFPQYNNKEVCVVPIDKAISMTLR